MILSDYVNTFGQMMLKRYGERVHKLTVNAGFTCPNRDGSKGRGGCTFCNNKSFNQNRYPDIQEQLDAGRHIVTKRTGARLYLAYFQTYTNTYDSVERLKYLYDRALEAPDVIGLSVGTRPDCLNDDILRLLQSYQEKGYEVWLELGLQSAFDKTLEKINRGHDFSCYKKTVEAARKFDLQICTHLIVGLPGETKEHNLETLNRVLDGGIQGLKLHPLHVVKGTQLANSWRKQEYIPLSFDDYIDIASQLILATPEEVVYHRVTATSPEKLLLAPMWCAKKWMVLNAITSSLSKLN